MDVTHILNGLNDAQREAVTAAPGNLLVVAGAGSGKTRVLVHRIAWLIAAEGVSPHGVLAVTFTNKAAREMSERIRALLAMADNPALWVGTFHGLAHRLLRMHWQQAGLPQNFQILDADDQQRLVKRVMRSLEIDEARWPVRQALGFINRCKDQGVRAKDLPQTDHPANRTQREIYVAYEAACTAAGLVDFGELLLRCVETLKGDADLLSHYRRRFQHLLVDEFQDTNSIQYDWLKLLAGDTGHVMAVGDEDQSIYGWRGARVENVQSFLDELGDVKIIRLEQNYRSTGNILRAANALIQHNTSRIPKSLWTGDSDGDPISLYAADTDLDEARWISEKIEAHRDSGIALDDIAVLYRSNAQSRVLEEALIRRDLPYRIYGGFRFFERAEIKNALAYLQLMQERHSDIAFERAVNTPPRGIGERTLEILRNRARSQGISLWQASQVLVREGQLAGRARTAVQTFLQLIDDLERDSAGLHLREIVDLAVERSGLVAHHLKEGPEVGLARKENLEELVAAAREFPGEWTLPVQNAPDQPGQSDLAAFLDHAALEAGQRESDRRGPAVQMMTLHSAKGLEFPVVFLTGMEDGLFPHRNSIEAPAGLEEERRLCYVGITRAMRQLYLSHAETRRLYQSEAFNPPSRFIRELPEALLEPVRLQQVTADVGGPDPTRALFSRQSALAVGQRVTHRRFGEGVVLQCNGQGDRAQVQVNFTDAGQKWLILGLAKLESLD